MTDNYKSKLIEVALPLAEISEASSREKSVKHGHPANLHLWWARRPLAAARAVLWASMVDDPSADPERFPTEELQRIERDRLFGILERLATWESSGDLAVLAEARTEVERCLGTDLPAVLDPFAGGGAIPLEAQRLGFQACAGDLNPVAIMIERAGLDLPVRFAGTSPVNPGDRQLVGSRGGLNGIASDLRYYGALLRDEAWALAGPRYPSLTFEDSDVVPIAWIWARSVQSPDPSWPGHVPLVKSWVLGKRPKKPVVWIEPLVDHDSHRIDFEIRHGGLPPAGSVARGGATCIATGASIPLGYVREMAQAGKLGTMLMAVVGDGPRGRVFSSPDPMHIEAATSIAPVDLLAESLPDAGLGFRVQNYGVRAWRDMFTPRQLSTLALFSDSLKRVQSIVERDALGAGMVQDDRGLAADGSGARAYAEGIVTYLALALDKLADLNNAFCAWEPIAQCPRHLFGRQTISMVWDFAEANPFSESSGSFHVIVEGIAKVLEGKGLPASGAQVHAPLIAQRDAAARVREMRRCVVSTDPPYYDNVGYADLSDFFYVWMRQNVGHIWPDDTATLLTPKREELVADPTRYGSRDQANRHFEDGMRGVFAAVKDVQDPRIPATIYYAFKQAEESAGGIASTGWETFLQGLLDAGLAITATWPIRTENKSRLRAMNANALASSVVLACRPRSIDAALETRGGFVAALRSELPGAVRILQQENIAPVDLAQSAIGPGMRIFSRYARVVEADGSTMPVRTALLIINEILGEVLSEEEAELDPDTRFALTWFEQFAHNPGPYGDADVLARAKDTSVAGVVESGIVVSRDGKVRLIERDELDDVWSPLTDTRSTVWEATQHLIRKLSESESAASQLLATLGGLGARARQLAYLLFGVCERKGWADEAIAYNGLITAWPELSRLAASGPQEVGQQTLI